MSLGVSNARKRTREGDTERGRAQPLETKVAKVEVKGGKAHSAPCVSREKLAGHLPISPSPSPRSPLPRPLRPGFISVRNAAYWLSVGTSSLYRDFTFQPRFWQPWSLWEIKRKVEFCAKHNSKKLFYRGNDHKHSFQEAPSLHSGRLPNFLIVQVKWRMGLQENPFLFHSGYWEAAGFKGSNSSLKGRAPSPSRGSVTGMDGFRKGMMLLCCARCPGHSLARHWLELRDKSGPSCSHLPPNPRPRPRRLTSVWERHLGYQHPGARSSAQMQAGQRHWDSLGAQRVVPGLGSLAWARPAITFSSGSQ